MGKERKMKILKKIRSWYYHLTEGFVNLVKWTPIIWNDRDFDQAYLYRILHKKLGNMEKFFNSDHAWTTSAKETANEIKEVKDLIYNIISSAHVAAVDVDTTDIFGVEDGVWKSDRENPRYHEFISKMDEAEEKTEADKQRAFELMSQRIEGWWD